MWLERLENLPLFLEPWLRHQRRDEYWRHGSVCEDYRAIECPVYAVGGWTDGYTNAIPRLLEHLAVPRKGLIGPWAHAYPHVALPGPQIGFLQEMLRWWDHWLKGDRHRRDGRADAARVDDRQRAACAAITRNGRGDGSPNRPGRRRRHGAAPVPRPMADCDRRARR